MWDKYSTYFCGRQTSRKRWGGSSLSLNSENSEKKETFKTVRNILASILCNHYLSQHVYTLWISIRKHNRYRDVSGSWKRYRVEQIVMVSKTMICNMLKICLYIVLCSVLRDIFFHTSWSMSLKLLGEP